MRRLVLAVLTLLVSSSCISTSPGVQSQGTPLGQVASAPATVATFEPLDAPAGDCIGDATSRLSVLSVASGPDFHVVFPAALKTPELDRVGALQIVVYRDGWPGVVLGKPGARRTRQPYTWDVCVRPNDGSTIGGLPFVVYGDTPQAGSLIPAN
jgi:hypothetical protein